MDKKKSDVFIFFTVMNVNWLITGLYQGYTVEQETKGRHFHSKSLGVK